MGLGVVWMYDGPGGNDPFTTTIDQKGVLTHGHLPENDNHGGKPPTQFADAQRRRVRPAGDDDPDRQLRVRRRRPHGQGQGPDRHRGPDDHVRQLRRRRPERVALDHRVQGAVHRSRPASPTRSPTPTCSSTPASSAPAAHRRPAATRGARPPTSRVGTYTYFCRIHPFMRGAFRVVPPPAAASASTSAPK